MAQVTTTGANTVRVHIEIPAAEVLAQAASVYAELARTVKVPGFRAGKIPRHILEQRYADYVLQKVVDELVPATFERAAEELKIEAVTEPRFKVEKAALDGEVVFDAEVAVFPAVELPDYKKFVIKREKPKVGDAEIDSALENLRQVNARLEPVEDRGAADGDLVIVKFLEGRPPEGFTQPTVAIWAGMGDDDPFGKQVMAKKPAETFPLAISYPADYPEHKYAGKTVHAPVEVVEVKKRVLPAVDADFAKDLGEDSLDALKAKLRERLEARAVEISYVNAYHRLIDDILSHGKVPLADSFLEEFLDSEEQPFDKLPDAKKEELRGQARADLGRYFIIRALARREGVSVSPEEVRDVMARAANRPDERGERPATVYDRLLNAKLAERLIPREEENAGGLIAKP